MSLGHMCFLHRFLVGSSSIHRLHILPFPDNLFSLHAQITVQDILDFEKKYKGSDEEKQDIIQLYEQHKGDMDAITASALCCTQEDEPRICGIIQAAIDSGGVKAFPAFTRESDKKKRARRKRVRKLSVPNPFSSHGKGIGYFFILKLCLISVLWSHLTLQADKERQEAEEMQKELGLGDQSDSLVMMLQVRNQLLNMFKSGSKLPLL